MHRPGTLSGQAFPIGGPLAAVTQEADVVGFAEARKNRAIPN